MGLPTTSSIDLTTFLKKTSSSTGLNFGIAHHSLAFRSLGLNSLKVSFVLSHLLISRPTESFALESFLIKKCHESTHLAMKVSIRDADFQELKDLILYDLLDRHSGISSHPSQISHPLPPLDPLQSVDVRSTRFSRSSFVILSWTYSPSNDKKTLGSLLSGPRLLTAQ